MKPLEVVAAIIENEAAEVLLAQRPDGKHLAGLWEFPGGKLEPGETRESALIRELREELLLEVEFKLYLGAFAYVYDWGGIELHVFQVLARNPPRATAEVRKFRWLSPGLIVEATLAPADKAPLRAYRKLISSP